MTELVAMMSDELMWKGLTFKFTRPRKTPKAAVVGRLECKVRIHACEHEDFVMTEKLDYAERAGIENLKERIEVAGMIQREANTALTLFLSGAGASLAYAAHVAATQPAFAAGALAASMYLFLIGGVLARECLGLIAYPATWNEPRNLTQGDYTLEQIRGWEIENIQHRIDQAITINETRSRWLNRCRYASALTPVIAVAAWAAAL